MTKYINLGAVRPVIVAPMVAFCFMTVTAPYLASVTAKLVSGPGGGGSTPWG
jgi:hypothetical protein